MERTVRPGKNASKSGDLLSTILNGLDLSVENILEDAAKQPTLFRDLIKYRIATMEEHTVCKMAFEVAQAKRGLQFLKESRNNGEKLTVNNLEYLLLADERLEALRAKVAKAESREENARLLVEAYRMRRDSFQVIANLAGKDIAMERSMEFATAKLKDVRERLSQKYSEEDGE